VEYRHAVHPLDKRLMHNYILLILCFGIKLATARSIPRFNGIATAINEAFEGSGLRGQQFTYSISVAEGQVTVTPAASDPIGTATLKAVLSTYVDSSVPGQTYTASGKLARWGIMARRRDGCCEVD